MPRMLYARVIPAPFRFVSITGPIPGSLEGGFCPMGCLTKSRCTFEGVLIVPREKKNNDVK